MKTEGKFKVTLTPLEEKPLNISKIKKEYEGGLSGTSEGCMIGYISSNGAGGYVAQEIFIGVLDGKKGSFVLQHTGEMSEAGESLVITLVPGSGTDELEGISGKYTIERKDGEHLYSFQYTLD